MMFSYAQRTPVAILAQVFCSVSSLICTGPVHAMPKVTLSLGGVKCHCIPSQVDVVAEKLRKVVDLGMGPQLPANALAIADFVGESHSHIAITLGDPAFDLRLAVQAMRRCLDKG